MSERSGTAAVLSLLLCAVLVLSSVAAGLASAAEKTASHDRIASVISNRKLSEYIAAAGFSEGLAGVINDGDISEKLIETAENYVSDIKNNDGGGRIDADMITDLVAGTVDSAVGFGIGTAYRDSIGDMLRAGDIEESSDLGKLREGHPVFFAAARLLLQDAAFAVCVSIAAVTFLTLLLLHRKRARRAFIYAGAAGLVSGAALLLFTLMKAPASEAYKSFIGGIVASESGNSFISGLIGLDSFYAGLADMLSDIGCELLALTAADVARAAVFTAAAGVVCLIAALAVAMAKPNIK